MRIVSYSLLLVALSVSVMAVEAKPAAEAKKSTMENVIIRQVGELEINFKSNNSLQAMRHGVDITFGGATPEEDMDIVAETIVFTYASEKDKKPSGMELSGDILIKSGELLIKSQKATINTVTQEAYFSGETHVTLPDFGAFDVKNIRINLETGAILAKEVNGTGSPKPAPTESAK